MTVCGEVTYLCRVDKPDEVPGILLHVKHVWTGSLMVCWLQQAAQSLQGRPVSALDLCAILRGIFTMLDYAKGETRNEDAHHENQGRPNFEGVHIFKGNDDEVSGANVATASRAHGATEMGKEAAILKGRREAKKAKDAAAKAKAATAGGGKGE